MACDKTCAASVEGELTRLRALVKKLSEEKRALQLEVERGDSHQANITTQLEVITKNENELQKEFKKDKSEMLHMFDVRKPHHHSHLFSTAVTTCLFNP